MRSEEIGLALARLRRNYWRQKDVMDVCDELEKRLIRELGEEVRVRKAKAAAKERRFYDAPLESALSEAAVCEDEVATSGAAAD